MFGFDPVSLSTAYILAGMTGCPPAGRPTVDVRLVQSEAPVVETNSSRDLSVRNGKKAPTAGGSTVAVEKSEWGTAGLHEGRMQTRYLLKFVEATNKADKSVCLSLKSIEYEIVYDPVIYIASDLLNKTCTYPVVLAHEQSHGEADIRTITDYIPTLKSQIERYALNLGVRGPLTTPEALAAEQKRFSDIIGKASAPAWNQLNWWREKRQTEIDLLKNYKQAWDLCPGRWIKF